MSERLNEKVIASLIQEKKEVPADWDNLSQMKEKKGHKEKEITIKRRDGSEFKIIMRQNNINILDFSAILGYLPKNSNQVFKLKRYNGRGHQHTNKIERVTLDGFHIHLATERYQEAGFGEETYAESTDRYSSLSEALDCLAEDCNLHAPHEKQTKLF